MKRLSIIIPHYNDYDLLESLLLSIPKQDDIEVIVIDDNSDSPLYIENLKKTFNNVLFLVNDIGKKGAGTCRNIGIDKSTGQWVLFADSDDIFIEGFYEKVKGFFESDYDIVYFPPTSRYLNSDTESDRHTLFRDLCKDYLNNYSKKSVLHLKYRFIIPWSKLFRKELILANNISFDEQMASEDVMFSVKTAFHSSKISVCDEEIYCVNKRVGSITSKRKEETFDIMLDTFLRKNLFLKDYISAEEYKLLDSSGFTLIMKGLSFGLHKGLDTMKLLKKNRIKMISKRNLNLAYWTHKIYHRILFRMVSKKPN